MAEGGLFKVSEELAELIKECAELNQVIAKRLAYPNTSEHPDGKGDLVARIEDEMGDVLASIEFVIKSLELDEKRIEKRAQIKQELFQQWSVEP